MIRADLAVGHRQPLHRADARRRRRPPRARRRRDAGDRRRRPASSTSTSCSTRSTRRRAGSLQERHPGLRHAVRRHGRGGRPGRRSTSTRSLSTSRRLVNQLTAGRRRADRFLVNSSRAVTRDRRAPRRPRRRWSATRTRRRRRSRAENAALDAGARGCCRPRCARANTTFVNLRATLDDLDVLVDASKPATKDLAPFLRELRPLVARRAPDDPRPAPAGHARPGPNNDLDRRDAQDAARCSSVATPGVPQRSTRRS